jgi:hypothetical protein
MENKIVPKKPGIYRLGRTLITTSLLVAVVGLIGLVLNVLEYGSQFFLQEEAMLFFLLTVYASVLFMPAQQVRNLGEDYQIFFEENAVPAPTIEKFGFLLIRSAYPTRMTNYTSYVIFWVIISIGGLALYSTQSSIGMAVWINFLSYLWVSVSAGLLLLFSVLLVGFYLSYMQKMLPEEG